MRLLPPLPCPAGPCPVLQDRAVSLATAVKAVGSGDAAPLEQLQHQQDEQLEQDEKSWDTMMDTFTQVQGLAARPGAGNAQGSPAIVQPKQLALAPMQACLAHGRVAPVLPGCPSPQPPIPNPTPAT